MKSKPKPEKVGRTFLGLLAELGVAASDSRRWLRRWMVFFAESMREVNRKPPSLRTRSTNKSKFRVVVSLSAYLEPDGRSCHFVAFAFQSRVWRESRRSTQLAPLMQSNTKVKVKKNLNANNRVKLRTWLVAGVRMTAGCGVR